MYVVVFVWFKHCTLIYQRWWMHKRFWYTLETGCCSVQNIKGMVNTKDLLLTLFTYHQPLLATLLKAIFGLFSSFLARTAVLGKASNRGWFIVEIQIQIWPKYKWYKCKEEIIQIHRRNYTNTKKKWYKYKQQMLCSDQLAGRATGDGL